MQQARLQQKRQSGFTLLELLVASAIFAVIGAVSYTGWYNIQNLKSGIEAQAQRLDELQRAWYWIAQDFEHAIDRPVRDQLGSERIAFEASDVGSSLVEFTRAGWTNPAAGVLPNRSSLQRVAYSLEEQNLYRHYWYHLDGVDDEAKKRRLLLTRIDSLSIRYLDAKNEWKDSWPPRNTEGSGATPKAVELTLGFEDLGEIKRRFALP
ncbi:MAG: type II secretion system minor pseudopilin GspJ [Pseudomonadota bacterium]